MLCLLFIVAILSGTQSARILGIFPTPSVSHHIVFNTYIQELVKRGHDVLVVTPNPTQPKDKPIKNLTEIDISYFYGDVESTWKSMFDVAKRGVVIDFNGAFQAQTFENMANTTKGVFTNPEFKRIVEDKNQHFDLIILEAFVDYHLIASKLFKAPVILMSSFYGFSEGFDVMGGVSRHPILYPNILRSKFSNLSTWEILKECYNEYKIMKKFQEIEDFQNALLKKNFGADAPTIQELKSNVEMLFLNSHPLFADNRPVPPGVVFLGALQLKPVKELPRDLKSYLDNSKRGVVYVSLGSNVRPELMDKDLLDAFIGTFEALPYDILWKYDGNLENMPKNLKIQKWFPQRDLLTHPNVKAFVTQGGLQSIDEAIDAGVPLVGIPIFGDQWFNTNKFVQHGIGVQLDALTLESKDLISAVKTVIDDRSFRENIKRLREIMNDQPQRPLERAVWWTEHVLRHGGARHLRSPAANMSWTEYFMLDIFIPVFSVLFILLTIILIVTILTITSIFSGGTKKSKVKRN